MRSYLQIAALLVLPMMRCTTHKETKGDNTDPFIQAASQTELMLRSIADAADTLAQSQKVSPRTLHEGHLVLVPSRDWTSGFFPGQLWYLYEHTGDARWKETADRFTRQLEREQWNNKTHDMGFKIYCSYGNGFRLTNDSTYRRVIVQSAKTLITRFKPKAGIIRSWDHNKDKWDCPVIIDNMMNLELLFEASKLTGDSVYYHVATSHANTTMKNHFRDDRSSYHVVDYDTVTGKVRARQTHQGYADESSWSRGQTWGLYGFTMCYRETKDPRYLEQAEKIAAFILHHPNLPDDLIPYWDFNAPAIPNEPRDVSAAAVMASALYELNSFTGKVYYRATADTIITNLFMDYKSDVGANKGFILTHSTGSKPANSEIDVPLAYADYYYLEALIRKEKTDNHDNNNQ